MADEDIVWNQTVDSGKFRCRVVRKSDYKGVLRVHVVADETLLLEEEVDLAYAAAFGPDVEDIHNWQSRSVQVIDERIAEQNKKS